MCVWVDTGAGVGVHVGTHAHSRPRSLAWGRSRRSETPGAAAHRCPHLRLVGFSVSRSLAGTERFEKWLSPELEQRKCKASPEHRAVPGGKRSAGRRQAVPRRHRPVRRDSHWPDLQPLGAAARDAGHGLQKQSDSENKGLKTQELSASRNSRSGKATPHSRVWTSKCRKN